MTGLSKKDKLFCKRLLSDLVNIRSVSGEEKDIIAYLEKFFCRLGVKVKRIPSSARSNLVVSLGKGKTILCLNAHADTVPPSGKSQPRAIISGGRLYGLGSSDDKGPLVSAICAFKNLASTRSAFKGRVDLFVSIGEERGGEGTEIGIKYGYRAEAAVVCESTGLGIGTAQSGVYFMEIITRGEAAHGSKPWQGKNAIWEMTELVKEIERVVRRGKKFYSIGPASLNLGAIRGGDIPNRVPDRCEAKLDIRLMPGEDIGRFKKAIKRIFEKKRWRSASYKFIQEKKPMVIARRDLPPHQFQKVCHSRNWCGGVLVSAMSGAVKKVLRKPPDLLGIRGWTEAGNFGGLLNVPVIIFGPGSMGLAHSENEHIELEDVYNGARIYEVFIRDYLESADNP